MSTANAVAEERSESFIHIQNLPRLACRKDIREFFDGLALKKDGIVLREFEAFVAFDDPLDVAKALTRNKTSLFGREIKLSVVDKKILPKELLRIAKRKLEFGSKETITLPLLNSHLNTKRKIRPTPVLQGQKRRAESDTDFCPNEMNFAPAEYTAGVKSSSWTCQHSERFIATKKKLTPTNVISFEGKDNVAIFHPRECYEVKKLTFGMQWNCVRQDSILSSVLL